MRASWAQPAGWSDGGARAARVRACVALAAGMCGIALGRHSPGAPMGLWFALAVGAAGLACAGRGWVCKAALTLAMCLLMAGWTHARVHTLAPTSIERMLPAYEGGAAPGVIVRVECRVESATVRLGEAPTILDPPFSGEAGGSVEAEALRVWTDDGWRRASGRVRLHAIGLRNEHVRAGQKVVATGWGGAIGRDLNGGRAVDGKAWSRMRGPSAIVRMSSPGLIEPADEDWLERAWAAPTRWRGALRRRSGLALGDYRSDEGRSLMAALLLGRREPGVGPAIERFRVLGAAHLLSVSGFHLAVLAGIALWAVRLTGERGRLESVLVGAATLVYLLVLPTRAPIARSGAMVLGVLAGDALGRRPDRLASLAWVALGLLVWRPLDLWSIGYQLSVGITALLVWLGQTRHPWVFGWRVVGAPARGGALADAARVVRGTLATCVLCSLVAAPTILTHTGVASPIAPLASAVLLPVVLVDLAVGFVLVVGTAIVPAMAEFASGVLGALGDATLWVAAALEHVPGAWTRLPPVSSVWAGAATLWTLRLIAGGRLRDRRVWAMAALLGLWLAGEVGLRGWLDRGVQARIQTMAVGDGTCHLVRSGSASILWDAGSLQRGWNERAIERVWRDSGGRRVRTAIISHPNLDHYNALPALAGVIGLERVLVGAATLERLDDGPGRHWRELLEEEGVTIERIGAGDAILFGHATLTILGEGEPGMGMNDRSLVARLEVATERGPLRALFTGDIQDEAMGLLASRGVDVRADVLELPHHGSFTPGGPGFIERVGPSVVVQSTGVDRIGDPRWEGARRGRVWWTTAAHGAAWVELRRDGSVVTGARLAGDERDLARRAGGGPGG